MQSRHLKALGALLAGMILCFVSLIHLPWVQRSVTGMVAKRLNERFGLKLQLDGYRFWPPRQLTLRGMRIRYGDLEVLSCDTVHLRWSMELNRPYFKVDEVVLDEPVLRLEQGPDGRWRLPSERASQFAGELGARSFSEPGARPDLHFPPMRILNGRIIAVRESGSTFSVERVNGTIQVAVAFDAQGMPRFQIHLGVGQSLLLRPGSPAKAAASG